MQGDETFETFDNLYKYETYIKQCNNNNNGNNSKYNFKFNNNDDTTNYQRDKNNNRRDDDESTHLNNNTSSAAHSPVQLRQNSAQHETAATPETTAVSCDEKSMTAKPENGYENALSMQTEANNNSGSPNNGSTSNNASQQQAGNKPRRPSLASSGSVGRMETILEEPGECKVSVKEILARFETMSLTEVKFGKVFK
uniref:Uncharacterized protein n=1 Tax=Ceratitis capitata TaxID=7213 RepID=W8AVG5_CERCA